MSIVPGLHVPAIPLVDIKGNEGAAELWHNGPIAANVGVTGAVITTSIVVGIAHCPPLGVKV